MKKNGDAGGIFGSLDGGWVKIGEYDRLYIDY